MEEIEILQTFLVGSQLDCVTVQPTVCKLVFSNSEVDNGACELRVYSEIRAGSPDLTGKVLELHGLPEATTVGAISALNAALAVGAVVLETNVKQNGSVDMTFDNGLTITISGVNQRFENSWVFLVLADESREIFCSSDGVLDTLIFG